MTDVDAMVAMNTDPEVMRYITGPNTPDINDVDAVRRRAEQHVRTNGGVQHPKSDQLGAWVIETRNGGEFAGVVFLVNLDGTDLIEIGYRLVPPQWGQGFATEAASALLRYAFQDVKMDRIVGVADPENKASCRVLEKIGLLYRGLRFYYHADLAFFDLTRNEFDS